MPPTVDSSSDSTVTDSSLTSNGGLVADRDLEIVAAGADVAPPGLRRRVERTAQILRYYRSAQIARRLWRELAGTRRPSPAEVAPDGWRAELRPAGVAAYAPAARMRSLRPADDPRRLGDDLEQGVFTLLGERRSLPAMLDWQSTAGRPPSRLWRFHLHYQEYLLDLAVADDWQNARSWQIVWTDIDQWLERHSAPSRSTHEDAWHPYCISRRAAVWFKLLALGAPSADLRDAMVQSLGRQVDFLSRRLETDLGGNHLLENIHALALAGCLLSTAGGAAGPGRSDAWLRIAETVLRRELPKQVLPHGEHYERSPMYHVQILGHLLEIVLVAAERKPSLAALCRDVAISMAGFLAAILHPDGEIPLLGDSCLGEAYSVEELRRLAALAGVAELAASPASGATLRGPYWVWRGGGDAWIFDAGRLAADELPAHGHCDLLGFEVSIAGRRWFVDSGLFHYEAGTMRRYGRSSVAHNVVTLDDKNQCDVWSGFRMGYRGWPTAFDAGQAGPYGWAAASHNAYRRLGAGQAARMVLAAEGALWACLDHLRLSTRRRATGRLHLAPEVRLQFTAAGTFTLEQAGVRRTLLFIGADRVSLAQGWYSPRFGVRQRTQVLEYERTALGGVTLGWLLTAPEAAAAATHSPTQEGAVVELRPAAAPPLECRFEARRGLLAGRLRLLDN